MLWGMQGQINTARVSQIRLRIVHKANLSNDLTPFNGNLTPILVRLAKRQLQLSSTWNTCGQGNCVTLQSMYVKPTRKCTIHDP